MSIPPTGIGPDDLEVLYDGPGFKHGPSWSPDGRYVGFAVNGGPREDRPSRGLWRVNAETGEATPFPRPPLEDMCINCEDTGDPLDVFWIVEKLAWSPTRGNEIAYVTSERNVFPGRYHIALYDTTSAQVDFIHSAPEGARIRFVAFSPDGEEIAFSGMGPGERNEAVWVVRRDGTGLRRVAAPGRHPTWSPDGSRILYTKYAAFNPPEGQGHVWSVRPDGTDDRQVTFYEPFVPPMP